MADWSKILSRGNVEDRRGMGVGLGVGGAGLIGLGRHHPHLLAHRAGDVLEHVEAWRLDAVVIGDQDAH